MRARILYTNGRQTIDLFWLSHDGRDVYCGGTGAPEKRSYHESGKVHTKMHGEETDGVVVKQLQAIAGQFHLTTLAASNSDAWFSSDLEVRRYNGKKSDAVLMIDSRSIPTGRQFNVSVGLLEPGNGTVLGAMIDAPREVGIEPLLALVATSVTPWVYAILYLLPENFATAG